MKKLCVLYIGNTRTLYELEQEHTKLLQHYKKTFDVDTFCVYSDESVDDIFIKRVLDPVAQLFFDQNGNDVQKIIENCKNHPKYLENIKYFDTLDKNIFGRTYIGNIHPPHMMQHIALRKGIELIEEYEKENNKVYDVFIKLRFDFVHGNLFDPNVLLGKELSFDDILSCKCEEIKKMQQDAKEYYHITSPQEYIKFVKNINVDMYASVLYTPHKIILNLGGLQVKNYKTIKQIYKNINNNTESKKLIYMINDWFFMTLRENMSIMKHVISSYGQNLLKGMTQVFCSEYQLYAHCMNNGLLPIIYYRTPSDGLYKKKLFVMSDGIIPNGKEIMINTTTVKNEDNYNVLLAGGQLTYGINYSLCGEELELNFDVITEKEIPLKIFLEQNNVRELIDTVIINTGKVKYSTILKTVGRIFVILEFPNTQIKISNVNFTHKELQVHLLTYMTEGYSYDEHNDSQIFCEKFNDMYGHYFDSFKIIKHRDLDNPYDKKYMSVWKPYIIYKRLCELPENDILFYKDTFTEKDVSSVYPKYICACIMSILKQHLFIPCDIDNKSISLLSKNILKLLDIKETEQVLTHNLLQTNFIMCKNTNDVKNFFKTWIALFVNNELNTQLTDNENIFLKRNMYQTFLKDINYKNNVGLNSLIIKMKQAGNVEWNFPYFYNDEDISKHIFKQSEQISEKIYDGFILNKIPQVTQQKFNGHGCVLFRESTGELHFIKTTDETSEHQYVGYEFFGKREFILNFEIMFKNFVPDINNLQNIGIKISNPLHIYKDWIPSCDVNKWCHLKRKINIKNESDMQLLLLFTDSPQGTEVLLRNFVIE